MIEAALGAFERWGLCVGDVVSCATGRLMSSSRMKSNRITGFPATQAVVTVTRWRLFAARSPRWVAVGSSSGLLVLVATPTGTGDLSPRPWRCRRPS